MGIGIRAVLGHNFDSSSGITNSVVKPFSTSEKWFFQGSSVHVVLGFDVLRGNGSSEEVNFCSAKMTFVHRQYKACPLNAFESCSQVGTEVVSVIGCYADIVHILSTLVRLDDFVKVIYHEN